MVKMSGIHSVDVILTTEKLGCSPGMGLGRACPWMGKKTRAPLPSAWPSLQGGPWPRANPVIEGPSVCRHHLPRSPACSSSPRRTNLSRALCSRPSKSSKTSDEEQCAGFLPQVLSRFRSSNRRVSVQRCKLCPLLPQFELFKIQIKVYILFQVCVSVTSCAVT